MNSAAQIVEKVIAEQRIGRSDFFASQFPEHVKARLIAIDRLRRAGFAKSDISGAIARHPSVLTYWLTDEWALAEGSIRWRKIVGLGYRDGNTTSVALQVCYDMKIYPAEFFGRGRDARLVAARREAMSRLKAMDFSNAAIARVLKRSYSTIQYWMKDDLRERRRARCRTYTAKWNEARA